MRGGSIFRILGGFIAQFIGVFVSVRVFSPSSAGPIYWWTKSAIAIAAMMHTPGTNDWKERGAHVASGVVAYGLFRYETFPIWLLGGVCASNGLGEVFAYCSLKHFYPSLDHTHVQTLRFLGIFLLFPVTLASFVASVPGTLAFHLLGNNVQTSTVIVNYTIGHISGTAALLYPLVVAPILWKDLENPSWSKTSFWRGCIAIICTTLMCSFQDYHSLGFPAIIGVYSLFVSISAYTKQCHATLIQLVCTCFTLGLTAASRGPFAYVIREGGAQAVLIGTQAGITALIAMSAYVSISVAQVRAFQLSETESRSRLEKLAEKQTLDLFRIGHDMRNNSTLVQAICDLGDEEGVNANDKVEIIRAINMLNNVLVCDMVDMVNTEKATRLLTREDVDVVEVMKIYMMVAKGLLLREGKENSVKVHHNFNDQDQVIVHTNRERLHQVVSNLVTNAVKYTEEGVIVLGVRANSESYMEVDVVDSGIGMTEADVASVFDLFYRSDRAAEVNSGAGLGLYNVQKMCDTIGVKIRVSSLGEGHGSTFTLVIPKAQESRGDEQRKGRQTSRSHYFNLRVLVMDDSPVIRKLMKKYLMSFGCRVVTLASATQARQHVLETTFDVVITDMSMGVGESGPAFIRSVRENSVEGLSPSVPCIICSGNQFYGTDVDTATTDPYTVAITKPFSADDIAAALSKLTKVSDGGDNV